MPVIIAENDRKLERRRRYIGEPAAHLQLVTQSIGELEADFNTLHRNRTVDSLFTSIANHSVTLVRDAGHR